MGLITAMPPSSPAIVKRSCTLLKSSLKTSKVLEGATLIANKSRPKLSAIDVLSNSVDEADRPPALCAIYLGYDRQDC